jgi:hypothetical protein
VFIGTSRKVIFKTTEYLIEFEAQNFVIEEKKVIGEPWLPGLTLKTVLN